MTKGAKKMNLNGKWKLTGFDACSNPISIAATVPGCVHTDLMAAGIIKDLYFRDNAEKYLWIEKNSFSYEKSFSIEKVEPSTYIEFDGLDTYCDIYLNGKRIGSSDNMFIPHEFLADGVLKEGENTIKVTFRSPVAETESLPALPGGFTKERLYSRRIQCTYSWDWVYRFVTMGIYRDVRLSVHRSNEINDVYLRTKHITPYSAQVWASINLRDVSPHSDSVKTQIFSPDGALIFEKERTILKDTMDESFDIRNPELWYPNGYGKQPLYKFVFSTKTSKKEVLFGIRELVVMQLEDEKGSIEEQKCRKMQKEELFSERDKNKSTACFTVIVNDIKIMCKGANWVPCEPFPSAETPEKIRESLKLAQLASINMIRVWGGGIFEQDAFYEECDKLGILVTQDFLMACGQYPEKDEHFIRQLNKEAKYAAIKLRNHACLAWWTGDNENGEWGSENKDDFSGYLSATYGAEPILKEYDSERYFFPSSPYGGEFYSSVTRGTTHHTNYIPQLFDQIENADMSGYTEYLQKLSSRFGVEQPTLGLPFVSSLKNFLTDEDIFGDDNSYIKFHTRTNPDVPVHFYDLTVHFAEKMFGAFTDSRDAVKKQQMLQCEWMRLTFEAQRRNKWFTSGILYWMLSDCWPASNGWSIIDYYNKPKPAYYSFRRCSKGVVSSIEVANGDINVYISNDTLTSSNGSGILYLYEIAKKEKLIEKSFKFQTEENSASMCFSSAFDEFDKLITPDTVILCDIKSNIGDDRTFYVKNGFVNTNVTYTDAKIISEDDNSITVHADEFTPYVMLDVPYLLEDNCFCLLPGEEKTILKIK